MAAPVPPEQRAEILGRIKAGTLSAADAAAQYGVSLGTIRKWIRKTVDNRHSSSSELLKMKKENQLLKEIVASFVLERELAKKNA